MGNNSCAIPKSTQRQRAQRLYPEMGLCERCHIRLAYDRHHLDENPSNNARANVEFLCRRCHVHAHGLKTQKSFDPAPKTRKACTICGNFAKPLRKGRCHTCDRYFTVRDREDRRLRRFFAKNGPVRTRLFGWAHSGWRRVRPRLPAPVAKRLGEAARKVE